MVDDKELGALVARHIFKSLDEPNDKCQRIQGKGGTWPDAETSIGGFCETALASVIADALAKHRSY